MSASIHTWSLRIISSDLFQERGAVVKDDWMEVRSSSPKVLVNEMLKWI